MPDKTCNDCGYCTYVSLDDCYICDLSDEQIDRYDEACNDFMAYIPGW